MKIGVIMGGISSERGISMQSGQQVLRHLNKNRYEAVIPIVINQKEEIIEKVKGIDFAFLALHGKFGEDGTIQGLLEGLGVPYSGAGVLTSALCMNKAMTKKLFNSAGIETPKGILVRSLEEINTDMLAQIGYPVIVKPNNGGSSVATFCAKTIEDVEQALQEGLKCDREILIEQYIQGKEITSFVLNGEVFPTVTIKANKGEFFDYNSKYEENGAEEEIELLEDNLQNKVNKLSKKIWSLLDCKGYCRIDMIISNDTPYVLEVNTLPGLTKTSLIPKSAAAVGMTFDSLLDKIITYSLEREEEKS